MSKNTLRCKSCLRPLAVIRLGGPIKTLDGTTKVVFYRDGQTHLKCPCGVSRRIWMKGNETSAGKMFNQ